MTRRMASLSGSLLLVLLTAACGKYGPPVRASEVEPPEAKPFKKAEYQSHGCVVLEDAEIDAVARLVPDGATVDIED